MKKIFSLLLVVMLLVPAMGIAEMTEDELHAWALANGYVKTDVDALASATTNKAGGVNFGAIEWTEELQVMAIKEFLKGGHYLGDASYSQDESGWNYREMYQMATVFNNAPNNTNLELVLDIDSLCLPGVSEAGTSKPLHFNYNLNVSISWCRHLRHSDNALIGTANGFHGTITAEVTLNEDGTIATIQVDTSCEHADYGAKVGTDEAFLAQFIGKMGPFTLGEGIDAVTGATGSSKSAVDAINDAVK